jgi:hypothetical protein
LECETVYLLALNTEEVCVIGLQARIVAPSSVASIGLEDGPPNYGLGEGASDHEAQIIPIQIILVPTATLCSDCAKEQLSGDLSFEKMDPFAVPIVRRVAPHIILGKII